MSFGQPSGGGKLYVGYNMAYKKGFTLIEIIIVVAIVLTLSVIAIPSMLRVRISANESAAISSLRTVSSAAENYRTIEGEYPGSLNNLAVPPQGPAYIDSTLGCATEPCAKDGYRFQWAGGGVGNPSTYSAVGSPQTAGTSGNRRFCVDQAGVIYQSNNDIAGAVTGCPVGLTVVQ